jgi:tetratricopeptide (TPR) repeat protein
MSPAPPADETALSTPDQQQPPEPGNPARVLDGSTSDIRQLLDLKEYAQAAALAQRLVAAAEQQPGPDGESLQAALMNLALAQYLDGDYVGAEASYLRVIELVEASGRLTSPRLARAQAGLANTYYAGKRFDLAVARYEVAIALVRREQGLFTEEQIPFLEKYSDALVQVGRTDDAFRARRYILRAIERKHGADSLSYAQELESIGRWFTRAGAYESARAALHSSIEIVEKARGENAAELIGPLTALGECARRQLLDPSFARAPSPDEQRQSMFHDSMTPILPSVSPNSIAIEGQESLERAVAIASALAPPSQAQIADVRTLLGDWYQSRLQPEKGLANYQMAWQAAGDAKVGDKPVTELLFGRPVLLAYTPPGSWNRYAGKPTGEVVVNEAQLGFTVTSGGRVADPRVLSDAGDPKRGALALRAAQGAIYRPRLEKGVPVDTPGVTLEQPFYVPVEREPEATGDSAARDKPETPEIAPPVPPAAETPPSVPADSGG